MFGNKSIHDTCYLFLPIITFRQVEQQNEKCSIKQKHSQIEKLHTKITKDLEFPWIDSNVI